MIEKKTERQVKCLRTDNGLEFCSDEFKTLCKKEGIVRYHIVHHTPQNGVEERMHRTLMEKVRCMLSNSQLPKYFSSKSRVHCMLFDQPFSLNYYRDEDYSRGMVW